MIEDTFKDFDVEIWRLDKGWKIWLINLKENMIS
jgi:hypothetical protein